MKTTGVVVILSFLVFVLSANRLLAQPEAVLDVEGKEVIAGLDYYIVTEILGPRYSGISTGPGILTRCPEYVILEHENGGKPVKFHPVDGKNGVVNLQTVLNIMIRGSAYCRTIPEVIWTVDPISGRIFVTTPEVEVEPLLNLWKKFAIEKVESDRVTYKFVFCYPPPCEGCRAKCENLAICSDFLGVQRLCLSSDNTLEVGFTRALPTSSY